MHETRSMQADMRGYVKMFNADAPAEIFYERKNVICNGVGFLFARLMANSADPIAGVWGLAVGAGGAVSAGWSASEQPDPLPTQVSLISEIKRKPLSQVQFLDANGNPTTALTTTVSFVTLLNATTDNISTPIREMGLIGGGTQTASLGGPTNMLTAPYFDPANPVQNAATLINYVTLPAFILPANINLGVAWDLSF